MDELFVHHLLVSSGLDVRYEEHGRGPNFSVYRNGARILAIEVMSFFMKGEWQDEWQRFARLADGVNGHLPPSSGWFLDMQPVSMERTPSTRSLSSFLRGFIANLPPHERVAAEPQLAWPSTTYRDSGVEIEITALPMRAGAASKRDPGARIVGVGPAIGGMVDSFLRLRVALSAKRASRYGITDVPYAVVVANHDLVCSVDQVEQALYEAPRRDDPNSRGFFAAPKRNTSMSGVILMGGFAPWDPAAGALRLFPNQNARVPLEDELFRTALCQAEARSN